MFHPGVYDWVRAPLTAQEQYRVGFRGRAAHPTGSPTEGIDALAALIELFNVLSGLGRRLPEGSHVQGIITQGGTATNIVPEYAEGRFGLRALTTAALDELAAQLRTAAEGVALATGTALTVDRASVRYEHFRDCAVLSERFAGHLDRAESPSPRPLPVSTWAPPTSATSAAGCPPSIRSSRSWARRAPTTPGVRRGRGVGAGPPGADGGGGGAGLHGGGRPRGRGAA
ncbi:peptidase dimerization domain-containing protein [Streptomyces tricolor]|nr:peptidase dimerization domain-containing protein [Streptomyces tricolor]